VASNHRTNIAVNSTIISRELVTFSRLRLGLLSLFSVAECTRIRLQFYRNPTEISLTHENDMCIYKKFELRNNPVRTIDKMKITQLEILSRRTFLADNTKPRPLSEADVTYGVLICSDVRTRSHDDVVRQHDITGISTEKHPRPYGRSPRTTDREIDPVVRSMTTERPVSRFTVFVHGTDCKWNSRIRTFRNGLLKIHRVVSYGSRCNGLTSH